MRPKTMILTAVLLIIPGAIAGFILGILAINFIPDQCVTTGISTICKDPISLFGLDGYEATGVIGLVVGAVTVPMTFLLVASKRT